MPPRASITSFVPGSGAAADSGRNGGRVDRRLANRNLRTALIAGAISLIVFAASWVVGLVY
jgi:hypothetical protein